MFQGRTLLSVLLVTFLVGCAHKSSIPLPQTILDAKNETDKKEASELEPENSQDLSFKESTHTRLPAVKRNRSHSHFIRETITPRVKSWIHYFSQRDKPRFQRFVNNGQKYRPLIEKIFKQHGVPSELYYVGLIESGYYLLAKSRASAVGPWQFIRATGRRYGLVINHFIDERSQVHKATHAAAMYFKDLYNIFGSWELALIAYNAGENGIIRRIRKGNTRDYYKLTRMRLLPKETRNYIPKVLAAMTILRNPHKYGISVNRPPFWKLIHAKSIVLKRSTNLVKLSRNLGLPLRELRELNPDLKLGVLQVPRRKPIHLFLPKGLKLSSSMKKLAYINGALPIPRAIKKRRSRRRKKKAARVYSLYKKHQTKISQTYRVKRGDNLHEIAKRFKTSVYRLKKLNNMHGSRLLRGRRIKVPATHHTIHVVRRGEFLRSIARRYQTSVRGLMRLNSLRGQKIFPGQKLVVAATPVQH